MVDVERVCCMCGDVGFPDKIFRCINCHNRFQHSYCSNYYNKVSCLPNLCDWCQIDEIKSSKHGKKPVEEGSRVEFSVDKVKPHEREEGSEKAAKSPTGAASPRTSTRRYKLLKDVMREVKRR